MLTNIRSAADLAILSRSVRRVRTHRGSRTALVLASMTAAAAFVAPAHAGDVNWDNGSGNFSWDTTSLNWTGAAWNNAAGDGAIFGATGVGAISVPGPINVNSMNFTVDGYTLNGAGPFTFVNGVSTQTTGVVNVAAGATTQINVPVNSAVGFQKIGPGILQINGAGAFTGQIPITGNGNLRADVLVGGVFGTLAGGTLRVAPGALPATTNVSIGTGYLDIGANNVTIANLIYTNQNVSGPWNSTLNANNGVVGTGTMRVTGEINVLGVTGNNPGNSFAANLDLGGGTQVVRVGAVSSIALNNALMFTGVLSNGSLLKTLGYSFGGTFSSFDGMSLFGNNTYAGSTTLNGGLNVATGTNASTSILINGVGGIGGSALSLQGANGSYLSAPLIRVFAGSSLILDNNASIGASGNNTPNVPAAQNNNRIRDDAVVELRDASFIYRGLTTVAASETYGSLNILGGHNTVTITPNGVGGTADLTAAGNLTMAPRSTLLISGTTLGAAGKVFFNGTTPAADPTGILPRIVGTNDFVTYNGATGMTPFTGYSTDFSMPNTNVALTAAITAPTVTINALKRTGTFTLTIGATDTLTITSGMILNTSGTGSITGGTLAFGPNPGVLFGTNNISSAITGTDGLIAASGTGTCSGDMSGLTGLLSVHAATMNLNTNTFTGPIHVRQGTLNLNVSQTGAALGAITLGVAQNDPNLTGLVPTLSFSGAGANAVIDRNIIVDNGAMTTAGVPLPFGLLARFSPLSNTTGSQTLNGDITLNSSVNLQGGGAGGTGATNFTGTISGPATFYIPNGRVNFTPTSVVSNAGGFVLSNPGFTAQVTFSGTTTGSAPIVVNGGNNTQLRYEPGALPTGPITIQNATGSTAPSIISLNNSTINNQINFNGDAIGNVGAGITATWAGPLNGSSALTKAGTGVLILSNASSTYNGAITVNAGTLRVNGPLSPSSVTVNTTGTIGGTGVLNAPVTVNTGGEIAPGSSIGNFSTGNLALFGNFESEIDLNNGGPPSADLLNVNGTVNLSGSTLELLLLNAPPAQSFAGGTYLLLANDGSDPVSGTFASILGLPPDYVASVNYAFSGTDSLGRIGNGNDIAVTLVPEPHMLSLIGLGAVAMLRRRKTVMC